PKGNNENSFNIRSGIYKCSFELINEHWLLGVGVGNSQKSLNQCYEQFSSDVYAKQDYNTHNQYLEYWISMGILAPIVLIVLLYKLSQVNLQHKDYLAVSATILFAICFLTENVLSRHSGVILFSLFIGLYGYRNKQSFKF